MLGNALREAYAPTLTSSPRDTGNETRGSWSPGRQSRSCTTDVDRANQHFLYRNKGWGGGALEISQTDLLKIRSIRPSSQVDCFYFQHSVPARSECFRLVSYLEMLILIHMLPNAILMQMLRVIGDILDILMH